MSTILGTSSGSGVGAPSSSAVKADGLDVARIAVFFGDPVERPRDPAASELAGTALTARFDAEES